MTDPHQPSGFPQPRDQTPPTASQGWQQVAPSPASEQPAPAWQGRAWPAQQPVPASPRQSNAMAITALVLSIVAILVALAVLIFVIVTALGSGSGYSLRGTVPQVVAGEPYPGGRSADEVTRVIEGDGGTVNRMDCPDLAVVEQDTEITCDGRVDGVDERVTVTFEDNEGHFRLVEHSP